MRTPDSAQYFRRNYREKTSANSVQRNTMDIAGCQIVQASMRESFMLDMRGTIGRRRQRRLFSAAGLEYWSFRLRR